MHGCTVKYRVGSTDARGPVQILVQGKSMTRRRSVN